MTQRAGHGWWPYLVPTFAFLLLTELSARTPASLDLTMLIVRVVTPLGLLVWFRMHGAYPELKIRFGAMTIVDFAVGLALAVVWMAPFVLFPGLRPELDEGVFDPAMAGAALVPAVLALRMLGYAIVTPFMEELFMRSFVIRIAEVYPDGDFRRVPIGQFSWRSFIVLVVLFNATHVPWEWIVMVPWAVLSTLWLYYRKDLFALVVLHAATNGAILLAAIFLSDVFPDGAGGILPLWFFV